MTKSLLFLTLSIIAATTATTTIRCVNQATLDLIKFSEGFVALPSPDPVGVPTIGYGHQCIQSNCREIRLHLPLTKQSAEQLLLTDIVSYTDALDKALGPIKLNNNQRGVLVSWTYNVGTESLRNSRLIWRLRRGEDPWRLVAEELPRWDYAAGQRLLGLTRKRAAEVSLFNTV